MREDLEMVPTMQAAGWEPVYDTNDIRYGRIPPEQVPMHGVSFKKDNKMVWECYSQGFSVWNCAELIDGHWVNQRGSKTYSIKRFYPDRFPDTFGFIPDLKTVLELDAKGEL